MRISEMFYGLQGEGSSIGVPAVFIRFAGCNLQCKWCDTLDVWKRGSEMTAEEIADHVIEMAGSVEMLITRRVHVVITGGEPLLHELDVRELLQAIRSKAPHTYFELETNGTIDSKVIDDFNQVNCSPKLSSAEEPTLRRIVPAALHRLNSHPNINYKFVIANARDWDELVDTYGSFIPLDSGKVYLMPVALTREELAENSRVVWELAAEKHVKMSTRLQTITWSNLRGK